MAPSRRVRRRRRQFLVGAILLVIVIVVLIEFTGGSSPPSHPPTTHPHTRTTGSSLAPGWRGDGKSVTLAFGGDVHFEAVLADRLSTDPATALGTRTPTLFAGADLSMADLDTAITDSPTDCPDAQGNQYVFHAGPTAFTALTAAHLTLVSQANNHGEDCGPTGLQQSMAAADAAHFPLIGVGTDAAQAFAPYRATVHGQRIAVIAATQVLDPTLQSAWTATPNSPGVASAFSVRQLVGAVEAARRSADTVVVYLHWGTQAQSCPDGQQPALARALVKAGADVVVGANAHVEEGAGYLGQALVDYGLGNLAFYDSTPPETSSGALVVTVTGRHVDHVRWRPALIQGGVPVPLTGSGAHTAVSTWDALRRCAKLSATPAASLASVRTEHTMPASAVVAELSRNPGHP